MALFTDGLLTNAEDLRRYESAILDVVSAEGVDLDAKLDLAQREIATELTAFLLQVGVELGPNRDLGVVVVTEPLRQWHSQQTLAAVYRDAYNSQLNDRYEGKWRQYEQLRLRTKGLLFESGVGLSRLPVTRARTPMVENVPGGDLAEDTWHIRMAWQTLDGRITAASDAVQAIRPSGTRLKVTPPSAPLNAAGWHVYAGNSGREMNLQNPALIPASESWTEPPGGFSSMPVGVRDQSPDYFMSKRRHWLRG